MQSNTHKKVITMAIWGKRGTGKSTQAKKQLKSHKRQVVFDPLKEYERELGYKKITNVRDLKRYIVENYNKGFKISYQPSGNVFKRPEQLNEVAKFLLLLQKPFNEGKHKIKITLVIEEMGRCFPNDKSVEKRCIDFAMLISEGRHYGIHLFGISQRAVGVHTEFRDNCEIEIFFAQDRRHIDQLSRFMNKNTAQEICKLPPHHFIAFQGDHQIKGRNF